MLLGTNPLAEVVDSNQVAFEIGGAHLALPFGLTKFQILLTLTFFIVLLMYWGLAKSITTRGEKRSKFAAFREMILLFIRDQVAKPALGEHDYKRFLPFLWTLFSFILVANLLGMIPFFGTPTASIAVTGGLALISFLVIHFNGIVANHGPIGYLKTFIPHIEMNDTLMKIIGPIILVMMFFIEILGAFIRGIVLAIRLFANMLAGHTALFVILSFIQMMGMAVEQNSWGLGGEVGFWGVTVASVGLVTALSVLELFVACLQAFVFTFLTATFLGLALHPEH